MDDGVRAARLPGLVIEVTKGSEMVDRDLAKWRSRCLIVRGDSSVGERLGGLLDWSLKFVAVL